MFAEQHPYLQPMLMAHIKEHEAYEYILNMQQILGYELPPLEQLMEPELQNTIALGIAEKLNEMPMAQGQEAQQPLDPNAVYMADIQQKAEEIASKERIAMATNEIKREDMALRQKLEADKLQAETFKTQMNFEADKAKIESNEALAEMKENLKQPINNQIGEL